MRRTMSVITLTIDPAIQMERVLMHFASVIETSHCAVTGTQVKRTQKNWITVSNSSSPDHLGNLTIDRNQATTTAVTARIGMRLLTEKSLQ